MKIFLLLLVSLTARASIDSDLKALELPSNAAPAGVAAEKFYAVQTRYVPLGGRVEADFVGARNFNPGSFLDSGELGLTAKVYLSDRFFLAATGSYVFNSLSAAGDRLWKSEAIFPDLSVVKYRGDLLLGFNLFYGKFRLTLDRVFYFDHYVALGPGVVRLSNGVAESTDPSLVAETGFVFWWARNWNARLSVGDHYFNELRRLGRGYVHHVLGTVSLGFLFGGDNG